MEIVREPVRAKMLATRVIANVDRMFAEKLGLTTKQRSIGLITVSIDDVGYTALDEATKHADVEVVYARSSYAGSGNTPGPLSGEFIGILAGRTPDEIHSAIRAAAIEIETGACFYALDRNATHVAYPHVISRTGRYLSKVAGISEGQPLAYLIAPPIEALYGLDAALKVADVKLCTFYGPPTETNFAGGLLTGSQSACQAAADAFWQGVCEVAVRPLERQVMGDGWLGNRFN